MSLAYLHLVLNHFPLMGVFFAFAFLIVGWKKNNETLKISALVLFVFAGLMTIPTYFTGDPAKDLLRALPNFARHAVHEHEEFAEKAMWLLYVSALISAYNLWLVWKKKKIAKWCVPALLVLGIASILAMAWTNKLGGEIRHSEFQSASEQKTNQNYEIDTD